MTKKPVERGDDTANAVYGEIFQKSYSISSFYGHNDTNKHTVVKAKHMTIPKTSKDKNRAKAIT